MILLKEFNLDEIDKNLKPKTREASRAVLFDDNSLVPLLYVAKYNYHKLPGGGIDNGEDKMQALARECLEEVGCKANIKGEVGKIIEYRQKWNLKQTSYCYYGKILSKGNPSFTEKELNQGFKIVWFPFKWAVVKIREDKPENYEGIFIQKRDLLFLETLEKNIKKIDL